MKDWQNSLYPRSDDKGVMGAYEEAALMDDNEATFGKRGSSASKKSVRGAARRSNFENWAAENGKGSAYKVFSKKHDAIMKRFLDESKKLRKELWARKISFWEYRKRKKELTQKTDKVSWKCYVDFLNGKLG